MFNYRLKYKGLQYPSPDPTFPAKDFLLLVQVCAPMCIYTYVIYNIHTPRTFCSWSRGMDARDPKP